MLEFAHAPFTQYTGTDAIPNHLEDDVWLHLDEPLARTIKMSPATVARRLFMDFTATAANASVVAMLNGPTVVFAHAPTDVDTTLVIVNEVDNIVCFHTASVNVTGSKVRVIQVTDAAGARILASIAHAMETSPDS